MTTLENRIDALFLASDGKTSISLFDKVYTFLFVENIAYGLVTIVIVLAILIILFKKGFHTSEKEIDNRNSYSNEITGSEGSLTTTRMKNRNSNQIFEDKTDYTYDLELIAVITASIMAYMGEDAPEDGLVIRSIRKVNRRNHVSNYM